MPIYEYRCGGCGEVFEVIRKFSDKPLKKCIFCGEGKVEKLISQSSFVLKGSGWYKDGYSGKGGKEGKEDAGGKGREKGKGQDKQDKKDAKPASKPDCAGCPSSQN
jgi:putative FmdB family regulatory protein